MTPNIKYKRLDLKVGFKCNNYCLHCVQGKKRDLFGNKTLEGLKEELNDGAKTCKEVVFTGGEPTMHKGLLELIRLAKSLEYKNIQIQTNGRIFAYRDYCIEAIKAGANDFCIAIIGHNEKIHDYVTTVKGSFRQSIEGIRNLKSLGMRVAVNTVVNRINFRHLPHIAKLLVRLGVDQFQFAFPHPAGSAEDNFHLIVPRMNEIAPFVKKGLEIGIKAGKSVMTEAIPYCMMQGYENCIAEEIIPETEIFDAGYKIEDYTEYRINKAKLKGPRCNLCKYDYICEGPWKKYPEVFGWEEFQPV